MMMNFLVGYPFYVELSRRYGVVVTSLLPDRS